MVESKIKYEVYDGRPILILCRKDDNHLTEECPFCGYEHWHGLGDGHRVSHCPETKCKKSVTAPDGTVIEQAHGYIIKTGGLT
jgi:hypothetical protein